MAGLAPAISVCVSLPVAVFVQDLDKGIVGLPLYVQNNDAGGYWEDQGYNWFSGL